MHITQYLKHTHSYIYFTSPATYVIQVGSGKSSLLYSILGEMRLDHGSIYSHGSVAYVPQVCM